MSRPYLIDTNLSLIFSPSLDELDRHSLKGNGGEGAGGRVRLITLSPPPSRGRGCLCGLREISTSQEPIWGAEQGARVIPRLKRLSIPLP